MTKTIEEELFLKFGNLGRIMKSNMVNFQHGGGEEITEDSNGDVDDCHHGHSGRRMMFREIIPVILFKEKNKGFRQKEIAKRLKTSPSSVSELIDKLEKDGYIERRADSKDKRATLIFLTKDGEKRVQETEKEIENNLSAVFRVLSKEEKEQLLSLMTKLEQGCTTGGVE